MKLSYDWLKEFVSIKEKPEDIAQALTMSGSEVGSIEKIGKDAVMEMEITSNRPDCLNVIGLAREVSAVLDKDLKMPDLSKVEASGTGPGVECVIKAKDLCPRYTARIITDVKVREASANIKKHITSMGVREVNNIVDVTNYCLLETGQPMHAFDLDKIEGTKIIIREAKQGEKITTIDDVERQLVQGMLVIADEKKPIAIAGVMGGKETEVTSKTKNILLESAYFDPLSIRRTSRKLGLSSDSSYRFERGVDKAMVAPASDRAARIIKRETGGDICEFYDQGEALPGKVTVALSTAEVENLLGVEFEDKDIKRILTRLGMSFSENEAKEFLVNIPSFREDVTRGVDLIEEIARVYGYDKIPAVISKFIPQITRKEHSRKVIEKINQLIPAMGLNEIMTYSLISEKAAESLPAEAENPVSLNNPLSEEQKVLTPQLLDGMLRSISWNINRRNRAVALFEIGKIYSKAGKDTFIETPALCIGLAGVLRENWTEGERRAGLFDLKGILEELFSNLGLNVTFSSANLKGFTSTADVLLDGQRIGFLAAGKKKTLEAYDINQDVYIAQITLDKVIEDTVLRKKYQAIPRFPSSLRDISMLCDKILSAGDINTLIADSGGEIIRGIRLIDMYEGDQIPQDKKSLTYSIEYGLNDRTLTEEEIESAHSKIKDSLVGKLKITIR